MLPQFNRQGRLIHLLATTLLIAATLPVRAAETLSELTHLTLSKQGEMTLRISGENSAEGFDPQFETRRLPNGAYQITIGARQVVIGSDKIALWQEQFKQWAPAIQDCLIASDQYGFQVNLTSWEPLQPQIKSNQGEQVIIRLNGKLQSQPKAGQSQNPPPATAKQKQITATHPEIKQTPKALPQVVTGAEKAVATQKPEAPLSTSETSKVAQQVVASSTSNKEPSVPVKPKTPEPLKAIHDLQNHRAPTIALNNAALDTDWSSGKTRQAPMALLASADPEIETIEFSKPSPHLPVSTSKEPPASRTTPPLRQEIAYQAPSLSKENTIFRQEPVYFSKSFANEDITAPETPLKLQKTPSGYDPDSKTQQVYTSKSYDLPLYSEYIAPSEPTVRRAWENLRNGQADDAELTLRSYLRRSPDDVEARFLLAHILEQKEQQTLSPRKKGNNNQQTQSQSEWQKIISKQDFLPAYLKLVDHYLDTGNLVEAEKILNTAIPRYQQSSELWFHKGRLLEFRNDLPQAQAAYTNALSLDARHPEYHYRLAQTHFKQEDWKACKQALLKTLAISPDDARCWKLLGYLAEKDNQSTQAAHWYQLSLQPDAMIYYARLLEKQNQPQKASSIYQAVQTIADDDPDLLFSLAMIYSEGPRPQQAEPLLKRYIKLSPTDEAKVNQAKAMLRQINVRPGKP